jgi:hypothetical protein
MKKYILTTIAGIHTSIALTTDTSGYSIGVLEVFFPDEEEVKKWKAKDERKWISENNKRMEAICDFLNEKNL